MVLSNDLQAAKLSPPNSVSSGCLSTTSRQPVSHPARVPRKGWAAGVQGCWQAVLCREQPDSPDVHSSPPEAVLSGSQLAKPWFLYPAGARMSPSPRTALAKQRVRACCLV